MNELNGYGYIHDSLDMKYLMLYVVAGMDEPVTYDDVIGLCEVDGAIRYFDIQTAFVEMLNTGHLEKVFGEEPRALYTISASGKELLPFCELRLPQSVIKKARAAIDETIRRKRASYIKTEITCTNGSYVVKLALSGPYGDRIKIELPVKSSEQAEKLADNFRGDAENIYLNVINSMLKPEGSEADSPEDQGRGDTK